MALAATTIFEVETTGSDTLNGGAFDPGQTAGFFTDGAATVATGTAPVFTSASYNFIAGDVGAWVFVASGTNWTPGWYKIASVGANAATLTATIGAAVVSTGAAGASVAIGLQPSTVAGCATTASPTGATWSIDYSQQAAAQFAYTDLASAGAGLTVSSALKPFAKQQVGNSIVITGGTNFTTGRYVIASVAAAVATVVGPGNITTGVGASGTGGQGGALASLGQVAAHVVAANQTFQKTGTYTITSASTNIAAGCWSTNLNTILVEGYSAVRGDLSAFGAAGTLPTNIASGISTFTLFTNSLSSGTIRSIIFDGASLTGSRAVSASMALYNVHAKNCLNSGLFSAQALDSAYIRCSVTGCTTAGAAFNGSGFFFACVAYSNTVSGFISAAAFATCDYVHCLSYNNSGASSDGFAPLNQLSSLVNCTAYGNGRDGFRLITNTGFQAVNCVAESNTGAGFTLNAANDALFLCAGYNNTGGNTVFTSATKLLSLGFLTGSGSFFTNAAAGDFSLNNTAGAGALLRAAGYPGLFPGGLTTGYSDIGAAPHADPVSSGGQAVSIFGG